MALSASGLIVATWLDVLDTTQLALDLDLETHRTALFTNSISNNLSTDTAYGASPFNANEASGAGYTAGGALLTTTTWVESGTPGTLKWDADDVAWTTSTTTARGALIYADALAGNNGILVVNFGADYSTIVGTFTIQWAAGGIFTWATR